MTEKGKLENILSMLNEAKCLEDIFGDISGAKERYRVIAKLIHPDKYNGDIALYNLATDVFQKLSAYWENAEDKIRDGAYGSRQSILENPRREIKGLTTFRTKKYAYTITNRIHIGGTCAVFEGITQDKDGHNLSVIIKIPHDHTDNDLMEQEAKAFKAFNKKTKELCIDDGGREFAKKFLLRLPCFLESVNLEEPCSFNKGKVVNIFSKLSGLESGWYSLEEIRKHYKEGINTRIMAFVWNRILEGLTFSHASGVIHRAITPNHILIHAEGHYGNIIDWTASCNINDLDYVPYLDERYLSYFPDEILNKVGKAFPSSDIYMSAWCMVYLLGGDPKQKFIPDTVEKPIRAFLNMCLQPKPKLRPKSTQVVYSEFKEITEDIFGPKRFVELQM